MDQRMMSRTVRILLMSVLATLATLNTAQAGPLGPNRISDITNTPHNLSTTPYNTGTDTRTVKASTQSQICVFCHTPHGADTSVPAPLWNRKQSTASYQMYTSASMDAGTPAAVASSSKLCLSCHDGTLAIGAVNVLNGQTNQVISMTGVEGSGKMSATGATTGYTRNLGTDLRNDHPISITYDAALVTLDGELHNVPSTTGGSSPVDLVKPRIKGEAAPLLPLIPDAADGNKAKVECLTCHDPHIRSTEVGVNAKFLRLNRFQNNQAPDIAGGYNVSNDIICVACHNKEGWPDSAHANPNVANETYTAAAATTRAFPNDGNFPVWRAACLNCHDTHTVAGANRLLRDGVDGGGAPALEETCYKCHSDDGATLNSQGNVNFEVPDIKSDFALARHMPITNTEQGLAAEAHAIKDKDFTEDPVTLGKSNLANRHAECTDCHNPHRVIKNRLASNAGQNPLIPDVAGTHDHNPATGGHSNLISGVLRGAWGVEPTSYTSAAFLSLPTGYTIKKGVPPDGTDLSSPPATYPYVTREYQICLKCHSDYAYGDVEGVASWDYVGRPALGSSGGGTPAGTNGLLRYTNQAMEFQAPNHHKGETTTTDSGAANNATRVATYFVYHKWRWNPAGSLSRVGPWWDMVGSTGPLPSMCDSNADANCVCTQCSGGPPFPVTIGYEITNGYDGEQPIPCSSPADRDTFAIPGTGGPPPAYPGNPGSHWNGAWVWDGVTQTTPWDGMGGDQSYIWTARSCTYTGPTLNFSANNHRSWHPVMDDTGRTPAIRGGLAPEMFLPPWNASVGDQTMYCTDCHGSSTQPGTAVPDGGENGNAWGPHGSSNNFILKGDWSNDTGTARPSDLCFKCHDYNQYASVTNFNPITSGFSRTGQQNLHITHALYVAGGAGRRLECSWCHVMVPHGWKNKALLVNLNDVGPEVGLPPGTAMDSPYTNAPYYSEALLGSASLPVIFRASGDWEPEACGGMSAMTSTCFNPP